jgi:hypothetical protein
MEGRARRLPQGGKDNILLGALRVRDVSANFYLCLDSSSSHLLTEAGRTRKIAAHYG